MTKRTTYAESRTNGFSGPCLTKTPCGRKCCCEAGVNHELHICRRADCEECHGRERYEMAKFYGLRPAGEQVLEERRVGA